MKLFTQLLPFLILVITFFSNNIDAQINLRPSTIGINTDNPLSAISINTSGGSDIGIVVTDIGATSTLKTGIRSYLKRPTTVDWKYAVTGSIESGFGNAIGVYGASSTSTPSNEGRSYGLFAQAGNATPNYNYAVYGQLTGENAGTAIFAWDRITYPNTDVLNTGGTWAGYFIGKTRFTQQIQIDAGGIKFPDGTVQITANSNTFSRDGDYQSQQRVIDELLIGKEIQREKLAKLEDELLQQQEEIGQLKAMINQVLLRNLKPNLTTKSTVEIHQSPALNQNYPNPFQSETQIDYYVPKSTKKASFLLTGTDGKVIHRFKVAKGENQLVIKTNELTAGTYIYSLILDGKVTLSKQMVIQ